VRHEPPARPTAVVAGTPRPLEAVCLKAMAKAPADRYATAGELARDVQRWLADEPVTAYPDPLTVKMGRLARRYRTAVVSAVVLLFTITVLVSVGLVVLGEAHAQRTVALAEARDRAKREQKAREALDGALAEVKERAKAEAKARAQAEKSRGQAVQALTTLVEKVQEYIRDTGGMRPLRHALLKEAMTGFNDIVREVKGHALVDRPLATAYEHMCNIAEELGDSAKAREYLQLSLEINDRVASENPDSPRDLTRLGMTLVSYGQLSLRDGSHLAETRKQYQRAMECFDRAKAEAKRLQDNPQLDKRRREDWYEPAVIDHRRAYCLEGLGWTARHAGDLTTAKKHYLAALAIYQEGLAEIPGLAGSTNGLLASPDGFGSLLAASGLAPRQDLGVAIFSYLSSMTRIQNLLGEVAIRNGDVAAMHDYFLRSIELTRSLRRLDPASLWYRRTLATNTGRHGELCISTGELDRAEEDCRTALRLARDLRDIDPGSPENDAEVALQHYRLGVVAERKGERERALAQFAECRRIYENLVRFFPNNKIYQRHLCLILPRLGEHQAAAKRADQDRAKVAHNPHELLDIACVYSMCIPEVGRAKPPGALTPAEKELRQHYTDTCLATLREAAALGFSDWGYLQIEVNLDAIRPHPEVRAIVAKMKQGTR
jgi:tetratricopeptide (TPR) repeat protein